MKILRFCFFLGLLMSAAPILDAQQEVTPSKLLEWIDGHLTNCDCAKANDTYNLYKEKIPEGNDEIKRRIDKCWEDKLKPTTSPQETSESTVSKPMYGHKEKKYSVGDTILVGNEPYVVAYVRDRGEHGLAVLNKGWGKISSDYDLYVTRKGIPTLEELKLILKNRDIIKFYDIYWTCTKKDYYIGNSRYNEIYVIDFATKKKFLESKSDIKGVILLIHRF